MRYVLLLSFALLILPLAPGVGRAASSAAFLRPAPITMSELARRKTAPVEAIEVSDYVFGGYAGDLTATSHADLNPKKAVIIVWNGRPERFVFSHEASYAPWFELPSGNALEYQFFEGASGWAELWNDPGRRERNSFVDIIEAGPNRAWVRWSYVCVNKKTGEAAFRGVEDFVAYPNGLVWRRQEQRSLMPDRVEGYSFESIEMIPMFPVGKTWNDTFRSAGERGVHAAAVLDAFSSRRYDVFWQAEGSPLAKKAKPTRSGTATVQELESSAGYAMVIPFTDGLPFLVVGDASGYAHEHTKILDHSFPDGGGWTWISAMWCHWPIGWLNSQTHATTAETLSRYPSHGAPLGLRWVVSDAPAPSAKMAYEANLNLPFLQDAGSRIYYSVAGVEDDFEATRALARRWLDKGAATARPESVAGVRPVKVGRPGAPNAR